MKISKYNNYIIESKIDLILESKIKYNQKFIEILGDINTDLSKKVKNLLNKDININTNYIDINLDKDDYITFLPDDKVEKSKFITKGNYSYYNIAQQIKKEYDIGKVGDPGDNQVVEIIGDIPKDVLQNHYIYSDFLIHIRWIDNTGTELNAIFNKNHIERDTSNITRSDFKIGKFIRALLKKANIDFTPVELEEFVTKYKVAVQMTKNAFDRFQIVKGEDIRKWYLYSNYEGNLGSLGNSCMRYDKCQKYLDIYTENEDVVSLVILISKRDPKKISARALLWTDDRDRKFMDRVYTINHPDEELFKKYAIENEFLYRDKSANVAFNDEIVDDEDGYITVKLKEGEYDWYPYMDTLSYLNIDRETLTNDSSSHYNYELESTNGGNGEGCEVCDGDEEIECGECSGSGNHDCENCYTGTVDCSYCDGDGNRECRDCDGDGEIECGYCYGDGTIDEDDCSDCGGSGRINCDDCDGGEIQCEDCDGDGEVECDDCYGSGEIECGDCYGNGTVECPECT